VSGLFTDPNVLLPEKSPTKTGSDLGAPQSQSVAA